MLTNEQGHCAIERVYSDPSAAYDRAAIFKARGAYRVVVEPDSGRHVLTAWFYNRETALRAVDE